MGSSEQIRDSQAQAVQFFQRDPFRFIVPLKYLHHYEAQTRALSLEEGALLMLPTVASPWDSNSYPQIPAMILPGALGEPGAQCLAELAHTQVSGPTVFKFSEQHSKAAFCAAFDLRQMRTFYTYTGGPGEVLGESPEVQNSARVTGAQCDLYQRNGYDREEIEQLFARGARNFTLYEGGLPASSCFIYQNYGVVWEIAGVHTRDSARGRGYARRVVIAALRYLLRQGLTPRYQVEAQNFASIRLAESLGLRRVLQFEHWVTSDA